MPMKNAEQVATTLLPLEDLPVRVDKRTGAAIITKHYFPVSWRTLEAWPLTWRLVNGKSLAETNDLLAVAEAKLAAAAWTRGGRTKRYNHGRGDQ